jgi:hypothetical protein
MVWGKRKIKNMPTEEEPPERVTQAARDILDLLEEDGRELTRNEVLTIVSNVASNMVMAVSTMRGGTNTNPAERAGGAAGALQHMIMTQLEMIVRKHYGPEGVDEFNQAKFAVIIQCMDHNSRLEPGKLSKL